MIKAIIFDMDGVLIDAKEWHYEALNQALALFGYEISRHEHLTTFDGLPTKKKLEILSVERGLSSNLHDFINELKQQYTMGLISTRCKPQFAQEYALSRLKHEGYKLAVASNSIRMTVETMMKLSHLDKYLDHQLSNQDVTLPKPHPDMYLKAMEILGFTPEECLIVEDNENGIKAARASGAHVLVVSGVEEVNYQNIRRRIKEIESFRVRKVA